jgi:sugar phosphate isomerase/epimerase
MNLCVSNIAWKKDENQAALRILKTMGITAIDVAPNLIFDSIVNITESQVKKVRDKYNNLGFKIIAMQSLLYGFPPYSIFDGLAERKKILGHLGQLLIVAKGIQVDILVFGSPINRFIRNTRKDYLDVAIDFFRELCDMAKSLNIKILLEANPAEYGCNFVTNTLEAVDFINKVSRHNFLLNLDTSTIILNNENLDNILSTSLNHIGHVHISSPYIKDIKEINHNLICNLLNSYVYNGYVSLEMKPDLTKDNLINLEENVSVFLRYYK